MIIMPYGWSWPIAAAHRPKQTSGTPHGPLAGERAGAHILTNAIAKAGAANVMVIANGGRIDVSSWGGIVSVGAAMRSIRGVVTDGACRDVDQARDLGVPVFARAQVRVSARGRRVCQKFGSVALSVVTVRSLIRGGCGGGEGRSRRVRTSVV